MAKKKFPANNLEAIRKDRGLSRQQLADKVIPPTSQDTIRKMEARERGISDMWKIRLAKALECRTEDFLAAPDPDAKKEEGVLIEKFRGFSEHQRDDLIKFVHFLESKKD